MTVKITYTIPCSRCGASVEPTWEYKDIGQRVPTFEGMRFAAFYDVGFRAALPVSREDPETQKSFRRRYPLCDDCMAELLDWLEGEGE